MTTPAINTPHGIIYDAMQDAGLLPDGQYPTPEQYAKYMRRLRDLVNTWQTQGIKLWLTQDITVPLIAGQATYTLGPSGSVNMDKPLQVVDAYYLYSSNNVRRPLLPLAWSDWVRLGQVGNQGTITQYFVDKRQSLLYVTFWQTPSSSEASSGSVHLVLRVQATNPTNLTETMNFPEEWRMALRWGLADDICTGQPAAIMARCQERALYYRRILEDWDVEDTPVRFSPEITNTSEFQ